ncbi:Glycosyltransferase domain protein [Candidatus Cyrtobacter comes]|uniref:Glycosyltransferase domain protein n=1 Tax=Candidatus Cyrtobacter comes TaxID=675776 RepID=A0ABU5L6W5_9RICK|nr:hypothetical protein [Candidatus Cyrtobacter comes]MDZ5761869.1 Glycosyltransferase domain protein [Candidatus Cyrtobacter comes]
MQSISQYIARLIDGHGLSHDQILHAMNAISRGYSCPAQVASFLTALHMKGVSAHEAASIASAIQKIINPTGVRGQNNIFISSKNINTLHMILSFYMRNIGYAITINTDTKIEDCSSINYIKEGTIPLIKIENNTYKTQLKEFALMKKILGFCSIVDEIQYLTPKNLCFSYAIIESTLQENLLINIAKALGFQKIIALTQLNTNEYWVSLYEGLYAIHQEYIYLETKVLDKINYINMEHSKLAYIVSIIAAFINEGRSQNDHYIHFMEQVETKSLLESMIYIKAEQDFINHYTY